MDGSLLRRTVSALAAAVLATGLAWPAVGQQTTPTFSDIAGDTHAASIEAFAARGIGTGFADGTFRPTVPVTRGQMASFLARALELPEGPTGAFSDVGGHAHERAIGAIAAAGVTSGYPDGRFGPDERVDRAQMATFLVAAFDLPAGSTTFPDVGGVHAASVSALAAAGITAGYPDGTFRPAQPVTRGQMATFILAGLERSEGAPVPAGRYLREVFSDLVITRNLEYGAAPDEDGVTESLRLDLFEPADDTQAVRPAIVWVHGGGFGRGDRSREEDNATSFARRGYVTVSIDYRLRSGNKGQAITDAQHDAQAAVRWLRSRAGEHGIDPDRIAIGGTSAGAITALLVANTPEDPGTSGNPDHRSDVQAAVSISGFGGAYSPGDPPAILFHGTADQTLPYSLAVSTCDEIRRAGNVCELHTYEGAGHGLYVSYREDIQAKIAEFLHRQLF